MIQPNKSEANLITKTKEAQREIQKALIQLKKNKYLYGEGEKIPEVKSFERSKYKASVNPESKLPLLNLKQTTQRYRSEFKIKKHKRIGSESLMTVVYKGRKESELQ